MEDEKEVKKDSPESSSEDEHILKKILKKTWSQNKTRYANKKFGKTGKKTRNLTAMEEFAGVTRAPRQTKYDKSSLFQTKKKKKNAKRNVFSPEDEDMKLDAPKKRMRLLSPELDQMEVACQVWI